MYCFYDLKLFQHDSIFGAILIVFGLYTVVWGKSKDPKVSSVESLTPEKGSSHELPVTAAKSINGGVSDDGLIRIQTKADLTRGT